MGFFWSRCNKAFLDGDAELLENGLALEFVEVHGGVSSCLAVYGAAKLAFGRSFRTC